MACPFVQHSKAVTDTVIHRVMKRNVFLFQQWKLALLDVLSSLIFMDGFFELYCILKNFVSKHLSLMFLITCLDYWLD